MEGLKQELRHISTDNIYLNLTGVEILKESQAFIDFQALEDPTEEGFIFVESWSSRIQTNQDNEQL